MSHSKGTPLHQRDKEEVIREIHVVSFLRREEEDRFSFVHFSFRDYFLAKLLFEVKGQFLEFMMICYLKYNANKKGAPSLTQLVQNLPKSVSFAPYQTVGTYHFNLPDGHYSQFDVLAKSSQEGQTSLLIECKYWEKPVDATTVERFAQKAKEVSLNIPSDSKVVPIFYSVSGFTAPALERMKELGLAWSTPEDWNILSDKKTKIN